MTSTATIAARASAAGEVQKFNRYKQNNGRKKYKVKIV